MPVLLLRRELLHGSELDYTVTSAAGFMQSYADDSLGNVNTADFSASAHSSCMQVKCKSGKCKHAVTALGESNGGVCQPRYSLFYCCTRHMADKEPENWYDG